MSTKIGVAVRLRPFLENEKNSSMQMTKLQVLNNEKEIRIQTDDQRGCKSFKFNHVLDPNSTQEEVYNQTQIQDLINKVVQGFHSTIFAYGQTGSGKTYTMEGYKYEVDPGETTLTPTINPNSKDAGIIPRAIRNLFESIKSHSKLHSRVFTVSCSFLQIYNEKIYDLLNPTQMSVNKTGGLRLRWTANDQFTVENLFVFECKTAEDVLTLFHQGLKNKMMASHKLNLSSSRSHCILSLKVESVDAKTSGNPVSSKLDLVDLAGSERASMTGNDSAVAQKESIEINKSLFTLRQVISTLADNQKSVAEKKKEQLHAPYRDSKLTCLLKQGIGGNSYCLMIACIAPGDRFFEENLSTLTYATKTAYITNEPTRNEDPKAKLISNLKGQVSSLTKELEKANSHISFLTDLTKENLRAMTPTPGSKSTVKKDAHSFEESIRKVNEGFTEGPRIISRNKYDSGEITPLSNADSESSGMLYERLIESINTVKELLRLNQDLRGKMDKFASYNEKLHGELFHLHKENQDLREKLAVYESLYHNNSESSMKLPTDRDGSPLAEVKLNCTAKQHSESPSQRRTNTFTQELAEELKNYRLQQRTFSNKTPETSLIENTATTQQQKPFATNSLFSQQKKNSVDGSIANPQSYKTVLAQRRHTQKIAQIAPELRESLTPWQEGLQNSSPKEYITTTNDITQYMSTKVLNEKVKEEDMRVISPQLDRRSTRREFNVTGFCLPKLRETYSGINDEVLNNSALEGSSHFAQNGNNIWVRGFMKRRANSTLRKNRIYAGKDAKE